MKLSIIYFVLIGLIFLSCSNNDKNEIDNIVDEYYQTYNDRKDFKKFLNFYDQEIIFEDIINGDRIIEKEQLADFFDWGNPSFERLDTNTLTILEKVTNENTSVVKGFFSKFKWGQSEFEAMHFTTILTFNKSKKIIRQVDWINYPASLVNYNERKNSNEWIK